MIIVGSTRTSLADPLEDSVVVIAVKAAGVDLRGCVRRGETEGLGVFRMAKREYAGQYRNGVVHGLGVTKFSSGNAFFGQHCDGARSGVGVYEFASGAFYSGEHLGDMRHGHGV